MNAPVPFTQQATEDLDAIWRFIAENNRDAADRVEREIIATCRRRAKHPLMGTGRQDITPLPVRVLDAAEILPLRDCLSARYVSSASRRHPARQARPDLCEAIVRLTQPCAGRIAGTVRNAGKLALVVLSAGLAYAGTPSTLEEALAHIRQNVQAFETQLPDFVCAEKITSRSVAGKDGRVERETVIQSTFSGRQKHTGANSLTGTSFTEERRIATVNGQKWSSDAMPPGVFRISGGYSSLIVMIFGPQGAGNYTFSLVDGAIGFATRNGKQKIVEKDGLHSFKATGRAWFDPRTFEVVRIEEQIEPKGGELGSSLPVTVEYKPVRIGENQFYLPSRVSASARRTVSGKAERGEFVAEYTNYRKYGSSTTIQFPDADR